MKKILSLFLALIAILLTVSGCGNAVSNNTGRNEEPVSSQQSISESPSKAISQSSSQKTAVPDEHGIYDSAQDVADYLLYYHKLPENYMTKSEARKKGWESGALNQVIPGKCIGGDVYSNFEGSLPKNATYHECDIDTLNAKKRGSKRLVWSSDFKIYYTKDHYETFELIGEEK